MEDVVTVIGKGMLRWFEHVERMNETRLAKHEASMSGLVGKDRTRQTYNDLKH